MKLTACLIVRDEEQYLDNCLSRLAGLVHSIVVVDTGSLDSSPEIALSHGALLIHEPWREDFAYARNLALDHAQGDWILYIDADELLQAEASDFEALNEPDVVAATVDFRAAAVLTRYREYRLFRNRPDLRFQSLIHETVRPGILDIVAKEGARIVACNARIDHQGYEGDISHKHRRNHAMLLRSVEADPGRIYLWHALGECEAGLGNVVAAEAAFRKALALVRTGPHQTSDALIYADLFSLHFLGDAVELEDIDELAAESMFRHANDPLVMWWYARYLMAGRDFPGARKLLELILQHGESGIGDSVLAYDRRLFGAYSWGLLAGCDMAEGHYSDAVSWLELATEAAPENREFRTKLQLASSLLGREASTSGFA